MKRNGISVSIICVILFSPMMALAQGATPTLNSVIKSLSVELSLDREDYVASQPVKITYTITNHSNVPVYILLWGTPLEGFLTELFAVTRKDQKSPVPYQGLLASRVGPYPESYVRLEANDGSPTKTLDLTEGFASDAKNLHLAKGYASVRRTLDLSEGYALVTAGEYRLIYRTRILDATLERPVYKPDRLFKAGMEKTIALKFKLSENRKAPVMERSRTAPIPLPRQRPIDEPILFSYLNAPRFNSTDPADPRSRIDVNRQEPLTRVYREALKKAAEAKVVLNGTPYEEIARAVERFKAYFGAPDPGRWKEIVNIYGTIYSFGFETDPGKTVTFFEGTQTDCGNGYIPAYVRAYETWNDKRFIYICDLFWDGAKMPFLPSERSGSDSQVGAVLHEMTHLAGGAAFVNDPSGSDSQNESIQHLIDDQGSYAFGDLNCIFKAHSNPVEACGNADNYHLFAMNLHGLTMGLDRPQLMLDTGAGGFVSAKNGGGGCLDACGKQDLEGVFALSSSKENKLTFDADGTPHWIRNWTPFIPAAGDRVKLVTADRRHVIFAPNQYQDLGASVSVGADESDSGPWMIKKASGGAVHNGDSISLQASNGSYLASTGSCGSGSVVARASAAITPDMKFTAMTSERLSKYYVHLRTADGHYLSVKRRIWPFSMLLGNIVVSTNETDSAHCPHCTFILAVPQGTSQKPALMTYDGVHYIAHRQGGGAEIAAVKSIATPYVGITVDNPQAVRTGDGVTLRTTDLSQQWRFIIEIAR